MSTRVDAHHHVWRLDRGDYGWLQPSRELAPIYRDFDLTDLRPLLAEARVGSTVLVQAAPTVAETKFLLDVARASDGLVRGVVGWADLAAPDALDTLSTLAKDPLLKSVRPMLQDLADPRWIGRAEVEPALAALPRLGLRFDALVKPPNLRPLLQVVERHPDLQIVIDHCAKPGIAANEWEPWADDLERIARNPAVHCKLSGLVTEACPERSRRAGAGWTIDGLRRYVDYVLECFRPGRVIWGSDWPVVTLAAGYDEWSSATDTLLAGLSEDEQTAIRGGNARRFYGLTTD
jgi:L-fucono-1,5-lactonase